MSEGDEIRKRWRKLVMAYYMQFCNLLARNALLFIKILFSE
jgi:hypothetical protein